MQYLPVHVKGAKFSVGDLHFSQGDGEISFCGAIEIAGTITLNFKVIKGGQEQLGMVGGKSPIYLPGPVEPLVETMSSSPAALSTTEAAAQGSPFNGLTI